MKADKSESTKKYQLILSSTVAVATFNLFRITLDVFQLSLPKQRSSTALIPFLMASSGPQEMSCCETETHFLSKQHHRKRLCAFEFWTNALVNVVRTYKNDGFEAAKELTEAVIDGGYAYQISPVAFKPTWANGDQTFKDIARCNLLRRRR